MSIVKTSNVFLSSANRTSGTSSNYNIQLVKPIILSDPNNYFSIRLGSAEIPYVFNLINDSNNTITYSITRNAITRTSSFIVASGNYNVLSLLAEVTRSLGASILALTGWDPSSLFNFTYVRATGLATLSIKPVDSISTSITINNNSPIFMKCLGFVSAITFGYTSPSSVTSDTSDQQVNLLQNTAIYIRSENLIQSVNYENIVKSEMSDILAKVQTNVNPMSMILWSNQSDLEIKIDNRSIDFINLYVGDSTQYNLSLGNLDWTCRITINEWAPAPSLAPTGRADRMVPEQNTEEIKRLMSERQAMIDRLEGLKQKISA
jgi:hypothetical protein